MTVLRVATVLGLLALFLPGGGAAQGLGDVAARERARRDKEEAKKKPPVLTNEDLDKGRPPKSGASTGAVTTPSAAGSGVTPAESSSRESPLPESSPPESRPPEDRFGQERPYLDAVQQAQTRVSQTESRIQQLQAKLNPMSTSFIYGSQGSNSPTEEAEVREQLTQAEAELTQARQDLAAANQALQSGRRGRPGGPSVPQ